MPGDSITQNITVKNDSSYNVKVKLYVRSLGADEDSADFLSKLHLTVAKSENNEMSYMFDAAADQTAGMTDWICLGTLYSGGEVNLVLNLDIPLDLGDEYQDDNLVIALPNGRPCENRIIAKEFEKLKEKANLPNVVFHSLRHSSTTYKLKLNHGDLKATQGDTGHAQLDMITDIYAHILDEDRKVNAQKFEAAFYGARDLRDVKPPEEPKQQAVDLTALIEQLQKNPELASTLAALIANGSNASC